MTNDDSRSGKLMYNVCIFDSYVPRSSYLYANKLYYSKETGNKLFIVQFIVASCELVKFMSF